MVLYRALLTKSVSVELDYRPIVAQWKFDVLKIYIIPRGIIRDGDRKRGVHASPCVVPKNLFLEKIAKPFTL